MASYNKIIIVGHVGREPEMRYTQSGKAVTSFSLAVNTGWGENQTVDWFDVQCWEKLAEMVNTHVTKGKEILVEGAVTLNKWTSQDGVERSNMRVTARDVRFLGKKTDAQEDKPAQATTSSDDPWGSGEF